MYIILFYTTLFIGIIPLIVLFYKKSGFNFENAITPFIWLTTVATLYEFIGTGLLKVNTNYWFQLYCLLEFTALYYFFYRLLSHRYSLIYTVLLLLLMVFYVVSFFFWNDTSKFISLAINKAGLFIFILVSVFLWFKNLFEMADIMNLWRYNIFYFISGFFIYYSTTFLLFLSSEFIFKNNTYFKDVWLVNILATFILRILLITGVWKMKKSLK